MYLWLQKPIIFLSAWCCGVYACVLMGLINLVCKNRTEDSFVLGCYLDYDINLSPLFTMDSANIP